MDPLLQADAMTSCATPVVSTHDIAPIEGGRDDQGAVPCLWFDGDAEEAANFYAGLLPDSQITGSGARPPTRPAGPEGTVLTVDFTLRGQQFQGLNGGPDFRFNEAVSFVIECDDQAEVDRLWNALPANGGEQGPCGWLKDRFGCRGRSYLAD